MRLVNHTRYSSPDLKKRIEDVLRAEGVKHQGYKVKVNYARQKRGVSGRAWLHSKYFELHLTRTKVSVAQLLQVTHHELMHTLGVKHERGECLMARHYTDERVPPDSQGYMEEAVVCAVSPAQRYEKQLALAKKNLKKAQTRAKRAATILKKWERRVRFYNKKVQR